jgi:hypothetical protein
VSTLWAALRTALKANKGVYMSLIQEKVNQAIEILKEQGTDLWLTFVRETSGVRDPALDFLIGANDLTWPSALILTRRGEKIAIIGNLEKDAVLRLNVFDEILGYDSAVSALLRDTITRLNPDQIAVNTSKNNVHADGLTHAMYEFLCEYLAGTPYAIASSAQNRSSTPCAGERLKPNWRASAKLLKSQTKFTRRRLNSSKWE